MVRAMERRAVMKLSEKCAEAPSFKVVEAELALRSS